MDLDEKFADAQKRALQLPSRPSNEVLLQLYGLYKQGLAGDAQGKRPGLLDPKGRAKWDAWAKLKGVAPDEAKRLYVERVERLASA